MAKQVVTLYALTKGYLDDIALEEIHNFESNLYDYLDKNEKGSNLIAKINATKVLPSNDEMDEVLKEFRRTMI